MKKEITNISRHIADHFPVEQIILFGSHASRTATRDSDIDLCVVMKTKGRPSRLAAKIRSTIHSRSSIDIIVRSKRELEKRMKMNDFFILDIVRKGKVIYDRHSKRMG